MMDKVRHNFAQFMEKRDFKDKHAKKVSFSFESDRGNTPRKIVSTLEKEESEPQQ